MLSVLVELPCGRVCPFQSMGFTDGFPDPDISPDRLAVGFPFQPSRVDLTVVVVVDCDFPSSKSFISGCVCCQPPHLWHQVNRLIKLIAPYTPLDLLLLYKESHWSMEQ